MSLPAMLAAMSGGSLPPLGDLIKIPCARCIATSRDNIAADDAITIAGGNAVCGPHALAIGHEQEIASDAIRHITTRLDELCGQGPKPSKAAHNPSAADIQRAADAIAKIDPNRILNYADRINVAHAVVVGLRGETALAGDYRDHSLERDATCAGTPNEPCGVCSKCCTPDEPPHQDEL